MSRAIFALAGLQLRSLVRNPVAAVAGWGFVPMLWMAPEDRWYGGMIAVGFLNAGVFGRGAAASTISTGRTLMPTLPFTPRERAVASMLTAAATIVPALAVACALSILRGRADAPVLHAIRLLCVVTPFVAAGAAMPEDRRAWWTFPVLFALAGALYPLQLATSVPGAVVWGIVGTATALALVRVRPGASGGGDPKGTRLLADLQGPAAWSRAATTPARAYWQTFARMKIMWAVLFFGGLLLTGQTLFSERGSSVVLSTSALVIGMAALLTPIGPGLSSHQVGAVLARLPIAPRTVWLQGLVSGVVALLAALAVPTIVLLWRVSQGEVDRWAPSPIRDHFVLVAGLACAAVLVRIGWHLRPFLRRRLAADAALVVGSLGVFALLWNQLQIPLRAIRGDAQPDPTVALAIGALLTLGIAAWARASVGVPRRA